eukprot:ANDGO_00945.mRNA.1 hypothetical protein GUITHDRAFT_175438
MYDFHYNTMKPRYGDNMKLLFTDTDSLCYHIKTEDAYKDIKEDETKYDCSDYPKDHFLYSATNKKVIGKFKDEASGVPITEFVGLRSKMYSYKKESGKTEKRLKGLKKSVVKKEISFDNYLNCVKGNDKVQVNKMKTLRSFGHNIKAIEQTKVSLNIYDDKRYIMNDGIETLAFGHYKIQ